MQGTCTGCLGLGRVRTCMIVTVTLKNAQGIFPGKLFSREEIYSRIWGDGVVVGDRTIDVHVRKIRQKIGDGHISTVKGMGYKYEN